MKFHSMRIFLSITLISVLIVSSTIFIQYESNLANNDVRIISYELNPQKQDLRLFWKDDKGEEFKNIRNLKTWLESKTEKLLFAMNAGMFNKDFSPQGLYIENSKLKSSLDTTEKGYGNFYLQPNGVFCLRANNQPFICKTSNFQQSKNVKYATQSGPMLVIEGKIHPKFNSGSKNVHVRNGVGVLSNGNLLFAMSKEKINFFDFASFFKNNGCKNALYLDGFVSRTYLPAKNWKHLDGNFAIIIAEIENKEQP